MSVEILEFGFKDELKFINIVSRLDCLDFFIHCKNYEIGPENLVELLEYSSSLNDIYFASDTIHLVVEGGKLIAFMVLNCLEELEGDLELYVDDLVSIKKGCGKMLLDIGIEKSIEMERKLTILGINEKVESYYQKLGFSSSYNNFIYYSKNTEEIQFNLEFIRGVFILTVRNPSSYEVYMKYFIDSIGSKYVQNKRHVYTDNQKFLEKELHEKCKDFIKIHKIINSVELRLDIY